MTSTDPIDTTNRYLTGAMAPVDTEVTAYDLTVTGSIPTELEGRWLRNGPNPIGEVADPTRHHWFIGDGMVHGVRLRDGRAEWYRNRWVRSDTVAARLGESRSPGKMSSWVSLCGESTGPIRRFRSQKSCLSWVAGSTARATHWLTAIHRRISTMDR